MLGPIVAQGLIRPTLVRTRHRRKGSQALEYLILASGHKVNRFTSATGQGHRAAVVQLLNRRLAGEHFQFDSPLFGKDTSTWN